MSFGILRLNRFEVFVKLGCSELERQTPQAVHFDIALRFPSLPPGCQTDALSETVCFDDIANCLRHVIQDREFKLVEKLVYDSYLALTKIAPVRTSVWVQATKVSPPIEGLKGGASFSVGEAFA